MAKKALNKTIKCNSFLDIKILGRSRNYLVFHFQPEYILALTLLPESCSWWRKNYQHWDIDGDAQVPGKVG